jgi:hypothetical protein
MPSSTQKRFDIVNERIETRMRNTPGGFFSKVLRFAYVQLIMKISFSINNIKNRLAVKIDRTLHFSTKKPCHLSCNRLKGNPHAQECGIRIAGDQLYNMAKLITTAEYENIVYSEYFLIPIGPVLGRYSSYDPMINAQAAQKFSTAAFSFRVSETQEGSTTAETRPPTPHNDWSCRGAESFISNSTSFL